MKGLFLSLLCLCLVAAQEEEDPNTAIWEVFGSVTDKPDDSSKPNEITEPDDRVPPGPGENQGKPGNCECVPFYQCTENGTFNEYGVGTINIKIDEPSEAESKPCPHYLDVCCKPVDDQGPQPSQPPLTHYREPACGVRNYEGVGFKVTGTHNEANYGEFPWMVAIIRRDRVAEGVDLKVMECGGSIIHPRLILTGAHCVKGKQDLFIRAGEWDTQTKKELFPTQDRTVKQVIVHERYYAGGLHYDMALLLLDEPLELNEVVDTICLPEDGEDLDGRNCVSSGWGKNEFGRNGSYAVILKKVELPVVPRSDCQVSLRRTRLGLRFRLHETFICAGGEKGVDTCKGDGGSPLVCPSKSDPNVYVQGGIVAWGIGCGEETPGVYVNVPLLRTWIDDKMASLI